MINIGRGKDLTTGEVAIVSADVVGFTGKMAAMPPVPAAPPQ